MVAALVVVERLIQAKDDLAITVSSVAPPAFTVLARNHGHHRLPSVVERNHLPVAREIRVECHAE